MNNLFIGVRLNMIGKNIKENFGSGITLINNEIKNIMKVNKSLENRVIRVSLLKGTTTKISSQEEGFQNFLRPLMVAGVFLMKSALIPLVKGFLGNSKENSWVRYNSSNNFKWRNERYSENR